MSTTRAKKPRQTDFLPQLQRAELRDLLASQFEFNLAKKIEKCGREVRLRCYSCGDRRSAEERCKKKWCPVCQGYVAARNKRRMAPVVAKFLWPLFVTLTAKNSPTAEGLREMQKAFVKFRRWKIWSKTVKGGVCGYEMTRNPQTKTWHPHIHLIIDCEWLAIKTPKPDPKAHPDHWKCAAQKRTGNSLERGGKQSDRNLPWFGSSGLMDGRP